MVHSRPRDAVCWVTFLPEADVDVFVTELVTVAQEAVELGNLAPLAVLLTQWRHSAEVYADPALLEILIAAPEGDLGSVPAPSGQEEPAGQPTAWRAAHVHVQCEQLDTRSPFWPG